MYEVQIILINKKVPARLKPVLSVEERLLLVVVLFNPCEYYFLQMFQK